MKVVVNDNKKPEEWKPFSITITFETREEAQVFWHRNNMAWSTFKDKTVYDPKALPLPKTDATTYEVWSAVNHYLKENP